jgi:hypothetical protein
VLAFRVFDGHVEAVPEKVEVSLERVGQEVVFGEAGDSADG